jgi:hypothetical protein
MKSAYELALERSGVQEVKKLTEEQKAKITEVDRVYKSKIAEANLAADSKIRKSAGNFEEINQIKDDLTVELASINSKMETEKEKIRKNG